jgi:hypothetical protein
MPLHPGNEKRDLILGRILALRPSKLLIVKDEGKAPVQCPD